MALVEPMRTIVRAAGAMTAAFVVVTAVAWATFSAIRPPTPVNIHVRWTDQVTDAQDDIDVADHQSHEQTNPGFRAGIRIGSVRDGKVTAFVPDADATPSQEGVAVDAKGNMYGSLTTGLALRRYAWK